MTSVAESRKKPDTVWTAVRVDDQTHRGGAKGQRRLVAAMARDATYWH